MDLSNATRPVKVEIGSSHVNKGFLQNNLKDPERVSIHLPFSSDEMLPDHEIRNETSPWSNIDLALTELFSNQKKIHGLEVIWWADEADQKKVNGKVMVGFLKWLLPRRMERGKIEVVRKNGSYDPLTWGTI